MALKVAINGFGRIGRLVFREAMNREAFDIVAINDLVAAENLAYLMKYDSTHGGFNQEIEVKDNELRIGRHKVLVTQERDPSKLPWRDLKVDYVIEATGHFTHMDTAKVHLENGVKKVVVTAPGKGDMPTFVMGVNHKDYDPKRHHIVSNASCTTNCLAPITKVILDNFGIEEGLMTTIHAVTATQVTVDGPCKKNFRLGRGGFQNIIPSTTGAAKAVALCIPEVKGKLTGMAFRVPVANVSCVDLTVRISKSTDYEKIAEAMLEASKNEMSGFLGYTDEPVVSSDFIGSAYSSMFDKEAGIALNDKFYKLISWYDNEMGYSCRVVDLVCYMASKD